jgi:DNA polymerase III subunit gamma/tau
MSASYQVIARKYRPQRFSEVIGQEHVTQTLANAIQQKRIAHAYLFVGPRGTGKTTIARIFAKCLNCTNGPAADFPDDDPKAREITEGRSLDVLEIDGASNRGIDEIRDLRETTRYAPAGSRYKIYIIDEVHMLTKEAFNALLKTLEEPPGHVKFMFATTEPEKVLPTILSRCQRFDLRRIPSGLIVSHLAEIASKENVQIDEAALYAIARGAEGGMRDAESTLDQLISFCGAKIQESDVLSMFGLAARGQLLALATLILQGSASEALRELNDLAHNGKDLARLLSDLLGHFRNLLIYHYSKGDLSLLDISEAEAATLQNQISGTTPDAVTRIMEVLADAEGRLRDAASKKIFMELTLLRAMEARNATSIDTVLKRLKELRSGEPGGGPNATPSSGALSATKPPVQARAAQPAPLERPARTEEAALQNPAPVATLESGSSIPVVTHVAHGKDNPEPILVSSTVISSATNASEAPAAQPAGEQLEAIWSQLVEAVGRVSPFMRSYLLESHPVSLTRNVLTLGFDPEFRDHMALVDTPKNRTILETKMHEMGHRDLAVRFIQAEAPPHRSRPITQPEAPRETPRPEPPASRPALSASAAAPVPPPATLSRDDFKNDPLIRKALEIFKGTIVEVRA